MAEFITKCPHCDHESQVNDEWNDVIKCAKCQQIFGAKEHIVSQAESTHTANQLADDEKSCPFCGETIKSQAILCKYCKSDLNKTVATETIEKLSFISICPECNTAIELPESMKDKKYECKGCCETFIAKETLEQNCPSCGEKIKAKATVCKYCKHQVKPLTHTTKSEKDDNQVGISVTISAQNNYNPFIPLTKAKFSDFKTRASRYEFWMFYLISHILSAIPIFGWIFGLIVLIPNFAVAVRRLHDTGRSGWNLLLLLIPIIGPIILLIFLCQDSEPGSNQYGCNPKGEGNEATDLLQKKSADTKKLKCKHRINLLKRYLNICFVYHEKSMIDTLQNQIYIEQQALNKLDFEKMSEAEQTTEALLKSLGTPASLECELLKKRLKMIVIPAVNLYDWLKNQSKKHKKIVAVTAIVIGVIFTAWIVWINSIEYARRQAEKYFANKDFGEAAIKWYKKAAERGDKKAQFILGDCYYSGHGVDKDYSEAVIWFKIAAEQGYAEAQHSLGNCHYFGRGVDKDYSEAVKWYKKATKNGLPGAQYNLGVCYENGDGVNKDYSEAVKWFKKAAEQGFAKAQSALGVCYKNGDGVDKDYSEAVKWFKKAAKNGYAEAQYCLGVCYYYGDGVNKDYSEAVKWFKKAAEQGFPWAQSNLGNCYYSGHGVDKDYSEAVKWYKKAAEQGLPGAQYNLGNCYYSGHGVDKDYSEAVKWYKKAAEQGLPGAQYNLGVCYENGNGVYKDYSEAVKWFKSAAKNGDKNAQEALSRLNK